MSYAIEQDREAAATTASPLDHELTPHFPALAEFHSTKTLAASSLYRELRPEIERVLGAIVQEDFTEAEACASSVGVPVVRATAWNIERGKRLPSIIRVLQSHAVLSASDVLLLTELDYGMARTNDAHVAREIAQSLGMNYAFAPCYLALNKGSGIEADAEGENTRGLHGNALLSRHPIRRAHAVALPNGKDKMEGKEKRLGQQRAVVADIAHPAGEFRAVSLHLDAHSTQRHRYRQMRLVLDHLEHLEPRLPTLIGGDWNTSTYNSRRAAYSILGYVRRVAMGVENVVKNHYPYPERWFERKLFRELERRGYRYRELNALGVCTLHYDVSDATVNTNMGDWIPQWCFWFINWALKKHGGRCSLKLDWFAGKEIEIAAGTRPQVVGDLRDAEGVLSDHDAIVLDFRLES
ncbi:MAG TPA: endonuclease/exonuclease/phosphatase family protein [Pyrinomonadaceae bacterium]|nr:endonuclease/exonuclease/phosphatase family protein [Pyrinomonadaceae bacterium]